MFPRFLKTAALGLALSVTLAGGVMAQAVGTPAGTDVTNRITTLQYGTGAGTVTVDTTTIAPAVFKVDRKVDVLVLSSQASLNEVEAIAGTSQAVLSFSLDNRGNAPQRFRLDVVRFAGDLGLTLAAPATATPPAGQFSILVNTTNEIAGATPYADGGIGPVPSGETRFILIVANIGAETADNLSDSFRIRARALQDTGSDLLVEDRSGGLMAQNTIFADAVSISTLTNAAFAADVDVARDGADADEARIRVTAPVITATKDVIVVGELGSFPCTNIDAAAAAAPTVGTIPGACVEYTIRVTNNSANETAASNIVISDALPQQVTFRSASQIAYSGTNAGAATTTTQPDDDVPGTVSATIGTLPAGVTATFRIRATIN